MDRVTAQYDEKEYADEETKESVMKQVGIILHDLEKNEVRRLITEEKIRPDGRKIDEVRPLNAQVDLLPRVHGSALFTRGETQVLSVCTLGAMGEVQKIDGLGLDVSCIIITSHHIQLVKQEEWVLLDVVKLDMVL